jgi:hypothetical protein
LKLLVQKINMIKPHHNQSRWQNYGNMACLYETKPGSEEPKSKKFDAYHNLHAPREC